MLEVLFKETLFHYSEVAGKPVIAQPTVAALLGHTLFFLGQA
jgi:hypothetical protein